MSDLFDDNWFSEYLDPTLWWDTEFGWTTADTATPAGIDIVVELGTVSVVSAAAGSAAVRRRHRQPFLREWPMVVEPRGIELTATMGQVRVRATGVVRPVGMDVVVETTTRKPDVFAGIIIPAMVQATSMTLELSIRRGTIAAASRVTVPGSVFSIEQGSVTASIQYDYTVAEMNALALLLEEAA